MTDDKDQGELANQDNGALESQRDETGGELVSEREEENSLPSPPPRVREMMAMFGVGPGRRAYHPVFDKFEPEHVDKFLDHSHAEDLERLRIRRQGRWFGLLILVVALFALAWLVNTLLPENKDLLAEFLKIGVAFAGGVGGGYGLRTYQETRRREYQHPCLS